MKTQILFSGYVVDFNGPVCYLRKNQQRQDDVARDRRQPRRPRPRKVAHSKQGRAKR